MEIKVTCPKLGGNSDSNGDFDKVDSKGDKAGDFGQKGCDFGPTQMVKRSNGDSNGQKLAVKSDEIANKVCQTEGAITPSPHNG